MLLALPEVPGLGWLLLASSPALIPWKGRRWYAPLCLGLLVTAWTADRNLAQRWPTAWDGQLLRATGTVADLPEPRGAGDARSWRFLFVPEPGSRAPGRIRVSWYRAEDTPVAGQCWDFRLKLRTPHGSANPGGFDYERWLFAQGIGATASVQDAAACGTSAGYRWLRLRSRIRGKLDRWLEGVPGHALVDGLVLGDRTRMEQREWNVFRTTGTSHLMAVSGLHLGILGAAAYFLMRWLWVLWPGAALRLPAQKAALVASAVVGVLYAALSGFALPAMRAALMLAVAVVAVLLGGQRNLPRGLAWAWLIIVLVHPLALLSPSLWLSFAAVALIAWLVAGRVVVQGRLRQMVRLQLGLSVALVPLTLWFFGGASWVAPLANLVAIPAATLLLPLLLGAVAVALVIPGLGVPLVRVMSWAWWALYRALEWLAASAPHAWLTVGTGGVVLLLAMVGVVLLLAPRGLPLRPLAFAFLLPLFLPRHPALTPAHLRLSVLDVGQGLAAVVETRRHALLFDAGPAWPSGLDMGEAVVTPYLRWRGVRHLDAMIISHRDMDHRGGADAVRAAVRVDRVLGSDGTGAEPCGEGQRWQWDGVSFEVLNPPRGGRGSANDRGCVLRVATGSAAVLLPADIGRTAERRLVRDYGQRLAARVLVSPHHGSAGSSSAAFVAAVHPELVVHPAGWKNQFGFPRAGPVARYAGIGAWQVQTGEWGMLDVEVGPHGIVRAAAWRQRWPRLWQRRPAAPLELRELSPGEPQSRVGFGASP